VIPSEPQLPPRPAAGLDDLARALRAGDGKGLPPVERWNPPDCGDIDMEIRPDGTWFYMGTPIGRMPLVKLFASVLRRDGERFVLVTPVEKVGIRVADAPFQAVEMRVDGEGDARNIVFRTNVDDVVMVGEANGLRFEKMGHEGLAPYVHVRRELWARVTRAVTYDLLALGEVRDVAGASMFGVAAGGRFHPAVPARDIEGL
jgi:uncharacterized protein